MQALLGFAADEQSRGMTGETAKALGGSLDGLEYQQHRYAKDVQYCTIASPQRGGQRQGHQNTNVQAINRTDATINDVTLSTSSRRCMPQGGQPRSYRGKTRHSTPYPRRTTCIQREGSPSATNPIVNIAVPNHPDRGGSICVSKLQHSAPRFESEAINGSREGPKGTP